MEMEMESAMKKEIKIQSLSDNYNVRKISDEDVEDVYKLCVGNPLYYAYCPPAVTRESVKGELAALPPEVEISDKYYIGFYQENRLMAVMDLINGYPEKSVAFIGFFMTDKSIQGKGVGTAIIQRACDYLKDLGFHSVRLAWVKGNPQSERFWAKNYFVGIQETTSTAADTVILAERLL